MEHFWWVFYGLLPDGEWKKSGYQKSRFGRDGARKLGQVYHYGPTPPLFSPLYNIWLNEDHEAADVMSPIAREMLEHAKILAQREKEKKNGPKARFDEFETRHFPECGQQAFRPGDRCGCHHLLTSVPKAALDADGVVVRDWVKDITNAIIRSVASVDLDFEDNVWPGKKKF